MINGKLAASVGGRSFRVPVPSTLSSVRRFGLRESVRSAVAGSSVLVVRVVYFFSSLFFFSPVSSRRRRNERRTRRRRSAFAYVRRTVAADGRRRRRYGGTGALWPLYHRSTPRARDRRPNGFPRCARFLTRRVYMTRPSTTTNAHYTRFYGTVLLLLTKTS